MTLQLKPLHPVFAAEANGIDLRRPPDAGTAREIESAMDRYAVLVFRGQSLSEDEQIAFAGAFGPLDIGLKKALKRANRLKYDESIDISNVDDGEGRLLLAELLEHATQREFVYRHSWRVGDLVMWDNRCVLHRGRRYDYTQRRELRRVSTEDAPLPSDT